MLGQYIFDNGSMKKRSSLGVAVVILAVVNFEVVILATVILVAVIFGLSSCSTPTIDPVSPVRSQEMANDGRELVKGLAACGYCHGEVASPASVLSGGRTQVDRYGEVRAANLTPARRGIGAWTLSQIVRGFRASINAREERISKDVHRGYEWMSDDDAYSIAAYLKTLPPVEDSVERRELGALEKNTKGLFDPKREASGYIPAIKKSEVVPYGEYLTDHVARCGSCHSGPEGLFSGEKYLQGGTLVNVGGRDKLAPNISGSKLYGTGAWPEEAIVKYLQSGETFDGKRVDSEYCPVEYFKNAPVEQLSAIAAYLRTVDISK